jgi:hypothetical protein
VSGAVRVFYSGAIQHVVFFAIQCNVFENWYVRSLRYWSLLLEQQLFDDREVVRYSPWSCVPEKLCK